MQLPSYRTLIGLGILLGLMLWYYPISVEHSIQTIRSLEEAAPLLQQATPRSLILFDVDDTLTRPPYLLHTGGFSLFNYLKLLVEYPRLFLNSNLETVQSIVFRDTQWKLIEPESPQIIKELQARGITVLGLSHISSGSYGVIRNMPRWRSTTLHALGITFSKTYANTIFTHLPQKQKQHPLLFDGILCTNRQPKGAVLEALLDTYHIQPDLIIFLDNNKSHLRSVGDMCKKRNLRCYLVDYHATSNTLSPQEQAKATAAFKKAISEIIS